MRYTNVTDQELAVTGVGIVPAGGSIEIEEGFSNPNFRAEAVPEAPAAPVAPAPIPEPAPVPETAVPPTEQPNQN